MRKLLIIALMATGLVAGPNSQCGTDYSSNKLMASTANCHARVANDIAREMLRIEKQKLQEYKKIRQLLEKKL